jgi:hypothetical protein
MRLDSSGNLGLGVTPSAWDTTASKALQLTGGSIWAYSTSQLNLIQNAFYNTSGNLVYTNTAAASSYRQISGVHSWNVAASGTAGNTISFTQAMTLQASGGLSVGTTTDLGAGIIAIAAGKYLGYSATAYITPEDNVSGARIVTPGIIRFDAGSAERARITSTGALFVGTTSAVGTETAGSVHIIGGPNNNNTGPLFIRNTFATAGRYWKVGPVNDNGFIVFNQDGTGAFVANGGTSWTANSDERIKDIIEPITNAAAKVCGLRAVIGKYKTDEESKRRSFLIAQDVQAVLPEAVTVQNDEIGTLGLAYTEVIPLLVAAIQELSAKVTALESK